MSDEYLGPRVTDTYSFIQKSRFFHGDKFLYDVTEYINAITNWKLCVSGSGRRVTRINKYMRIQFTIL